MSGAISNLPDSIRLQFIEAFKKLDELENNKYNYFREYNSSFEYLDNGKPINLQSCCLNAKKNKDGTSIIQMHSSNTLLIWHICSDKISRLDTHTKNFSFGLESKLEEFPIESSKSAFEPLFTSVQEATYPSIVLPDSHVKLVIDVHQLATTMLNTHGISTKILPKETTTLAKYRFDYLYFAGLSTCLVIGAIYLSCLAGGVLIQYAGNAISQLPPLFSAFV